MMGRSERNTVAAVVVVTALTVAGAMILIAPRLLVFGVSLLAGLALGVVIAFVRHRFFARLRSPSEVEDATGLSVLATIPRLHLDGRSPVVSGRPVQFPGAYAHLAARLGDMQSPARCVLVTSPARGAGRTTIAVNLAASIAADGTKVALVSTDSKGGCGPDEVLGLRQRPGLMDVLDGSCSLESALQETGLEALTVLPAGPPVRGQGVDYSLDDLARVLNRLTKRVDLVVIEGPPVLDGPEAALLAQEVDLVLLAVDVRHGRRADTTTALSYLGHVRNRLVGAVANDPGRHLYPVRLVHGAGAAVAAVRALSTNVRERVRQQRTPYRRWGAIAVVVAAGVLISAVWWPGGDGRSDADQASDGTSVTALARTTPEGQAVVAAALERCRSARVAQAAPLRAAATSLGQWETHVDAMNQLVAGKITLAQANRFWERTRVGAAEKVHRFSSADNEYAKAGSDCRTPDDADGSDAGLAAISACKEDIAQRDRTLRAARVAVGTWHHHVADMNLLRAGRMSPAKAVRLWEKYWKQGMAELNGYRAELRQTADGTC